ncbi:hypothetical protein [Brenneria alni]|uniref:hypothetical protein n=1 Tax=Brenneria alni TaxID=71656 RepID=UPI001473FC16|nr:hypothetical protein [Brenneria alni]
MFGMQHKRKLYWTIHLAPFSRVGSFNRARLHRFNTAFVSSLEDALCRGERSIVIRSHLMRTAEIKLALTVLANYPCHYHVVPVVFSRFEQVGITFQMLLQEWRLVAVPSSGFMIVIACR